MTPLSDKERAAMRVLAACGYRMPPEGQERSHSTVSDDGEWHAAIALGNNGSTPSLVLSLYQMDRTAMGPIRDYSNLGAVSADREDYAAAYQRRKNQIASGTALLDIKEMAEERHARRELEALEVMMTPNDARHLLRRMLVAALRERGVVFGGGHATTDPDNPCLLCADHLATLIKSDRGFQRAYDVVPAQRANNQPHWDIVKAELRKEGVL